MKKSGNPQKLGQIVVALVIAAAVWFLQKQGYLGDGQASAPIETIDSQGPAPVDKSRGPAPASRQSPPVEPTRSPPAAGGSLSSSAQAAGEKRVLKGFRDRESDFVVSVGGRIQKVLPDDTEPPRHQRFILRLSGGHTLLVAHNIDLAPRAPIDEGDEVIVKGEYEYDDRGGVLHWTHHDPRGRHEEGWVEHRGKRYK